jgi:hypothetical protein
VTTTVLFPDHTLKHRNISHPELDEWNTWSMFSLCYPLMDEKFGRDPSYVQTFL